MDRSVLNSKLPIGATEGRALCGSARGIVGPLPNMGPHARRYTAERLGHGGMIWRARSEAKHPPAVVMALIDEKSLATKGRWPLPRSKIAALVDSLSQDKARVIGLDIEKWDRSRMALPES